MASLLSSQKIHLLQKISHELLDVDADVHSIHGGEEEREEREEKIPSLQHDQLVEVKPQESQCQLSNRLTNDDMEKLCIFNFHLPEFIFYEIASYLSMKGCMAMTSTCRRSYGLLSGYRWPKSYCKRGVLELTPSIHAWMQRSDVIFVKKGI